VSRCACIDRRDLGDSPHIAEGRGLHTATACFDASIIPAFRIAERRLAVATEALEALGLRHLAVELRGVEP
jgi:hypothetical protein